MPIFQQRKKETQLNANPELNLWYLDQSNLILNSKSIECMGRNSIYTSHSYFTYIKKNKKPR